MLPYLRGDKESAPTFSLANIYAVCYDAVGQIFLTGDDSMETSVFTRNKKLLAYCGLIFVVLIWGISPLLTLQFYQYYSPTVRLAYSTLFCALSLLAISWNKRKLLNKTYFAVAIPTGFFMGLADILQKVGLQYTTPTHYAFLENLSCLVVPILLFFFVKKKPSFLTVLAAVLCLLSSFVLTGMSADVSKTTLLGDLLCGAAGIMFGINIAGTGAFAKKLYAPLYLMIQMFVELAVSAVGTVIFHFTKIEPIVFSFDWRLLVGNVVLVFVSYTLCWLIRTSAMKHVDATVVAVMMPFSSIVTTIVSILAGNDTVSTNLIVGVILGLTAIILSGLGDRQAEKKTT